MNRPQLPKYVSRCEYMVELEKYCDELEQSNKSLSYAYDDCLLTLHFWEEEYYKCRKALDKACEQLNHWYEIPNGKYGNQYMKKEEWKEWALNNDENYEEKK